jgi:SAM-dependent methyltransferase
MPQGKTGEASRRARAIVLNTLIKAPAPVRRPVGAALLFGYRGLLAARGERGKQIGPPGRLPIPPPGLRARIGLDLALAPSDFLEEGQRHAALIREMAARAVPLSEVDAVLDFGCGCGRVARWFNDLDGRELHGCDRDVRLVKWCQANLPFLQATTNGPEPPLPYARNSFDVIYALSVLTHMSDALELAWLLELRRVMAPAGVLWFSVSGDWYGHKMTPDQLASYDRGERVSRFDDQPELCTAWHPPSFVRKRLMDVDLELVDVRPGSDEPLTHDAYLARKPS